MERKKFIQIIRMELVAVLSFVTLSVEAEVLGSCTAFVEEGTLFVIGNEIDNEIEIKDTEDVQVSCDGASATFERSFAITVEGHEGDDEISIDNSNGALGAIRIKVFGHDGKDKVDAFTFKDPVEPDALGEFLEYEGGPGEDSMQIIAGPQAENFNLKSGDGTVEIQITDIASEIVTGNISALSVEFMPIKMGGGNDLLNLTGSLSGIVSVFGQDGDDQVVLSEVLIELFPIADNLAVLDLGGGLDKFIYEGMPDSEHYVVVGVPSLTIPDPELRVTDMAGVLLAHVQFLHVEEVMIDANRGDDEVEVQWDAALMSDLSLVRVILGKGNDAMFANLLPVLTLPEKGGVQIAQFEVTGGSGEDRVTFNYSAGNWFDVLFKADPGKGDDDISVELEPPPDDGLPGPGGVRSLQFDVVTGNEDDFVVIHNRTTDESFFATLAAKLGGGDDAFEATGVLGLSLLPGPGFDTARITRNLRSFVTEFESVEILEEGL